MRTRKELGEEKIKKLKQQTLEDHERINKEFIEEKQLELKKLEGELNEKEKKKEEWNKELEELLKQMEKLEEEYKEKKDNVFALVVKIDGLKEKIRRKNKEIDSL